MTNFEYLIWILKNDEELVEKINSMESEYIVELSNLFMIVLRVIMNVMKKII